MGASPRRSFWEVTLPLCRSGMVIGWLFAFPASFEEFARALFLTTPKTITLQVKIWRSLKYEVSPVVAVVSTPQILFILVVVGGGMLARRHLVPGKGEPL